MKRLESRKTSRKPAARAKAEADLGAARAALHARLDAAVPQWRTLAGIDSAIAALGTEPPAVPHIRVETERTRYTSRNRPAASEEPQSLERAFSAAARKPLEKADTSPKPAARQKKKQASAGRRLSEALGLAGEGPARLSAIESEVEHLMKRGVGVWEGEPAASPKRPPPPPVRLHPHDRPATPEVEPPAVGEEAEVEIILLSPTPPRDERRPITRLADRLDRVTGDPDEAVRPEPAVSMLAHVEEAEVEIEVRAPEQPEPAAPSPDRDAPKQ